MGRSSNFPEGSQQSQTGAYPCLIARDLGILLQPHQVPRNPVTDIERFRSEMKQVFDDFVGKAAETMNRYLEECTR